MLIMILATFLVTSAHNGTRNFDECQASEFKPGNCWEAKQMQKAGKYLCKIQGKEYLGKDPNSDNGCAQ